MREYTDQTRAFLRSTGTAVTPTERLVLLAIADEARGKPYGPRGPRQAIITAADMAAEVGVEPSALPAIYRRLARRGLEVRVPKALPSRDGRMVFTYTGETTMFELPDFAGYIHVPRPKRPGYTKEKRQAKRVNLESPSTPATGGVLSQPSTPDRVTQDSRQGDSGLPTGGHRSQPTPVTTPVTNPPVVPASSNHRPPARDDAETVGLEDVVEHGDLPGLHDRDQSPDDGVGAELTARALQAAADAAAARERAS